MCLAIPVEVLDLLEGERAVVEMGGVRKTVSAALIDGLKVGDYVIVHTGFILEKMDIEEAERTLALMKEYASNADNFESDVPYAA
ncbi:MAG: HypC/HybG/HupF family hydrogenase formation chaperone [Candidatus Moraniibacteriota bacterium]|nr:MAG: HypC/HybG/HupF family hydrogenase formation chaperone [Candidatus Moranbacteria bacterium]